MSQNPSINPDETYDPDQEEIKPNPDEPYQPTEPDDPDVVPIVINGEDDLENDPDNLQPATDTDSDIKPGDRDAGIDDYSTIGEQRNEYQAQLSGDAGLGDDGLNYTGLGDTGLSDGVGGQADDLIGFGDSGLGSDSALGADLDDDEDPGSQLDPATFTRGTNTSENRSGKSDEDENYRSDR